MMNFQKRSAEMFYLAGMDGRQAEYFADVYLRSEEMTAYLLSGIQSGKVSESDQHCRYRRPPEGPRGGAGETGWHRRNLPDQKTSRSGNSVGNDAGDPCDRRGAVRRGT